MWIYEQRNIGRNTIRLNLIGIASDKYPKPLDF